MVRFLCMTAMVRKQIQVIYSHWCKKISRGVVILSRGGVINGKCSKNVAVNLDELDKGTATLK